MKTLFPLILVLLGCGELLAGNSKPVLVGRPRMEYPEMARRQRISGSGIYLLHVDAAGNVTSVDVAKSAGSPILDDAAIRSFKKFKFKPGTAASLYVSIQIESKRISFLRSESLRQFSEQNIVAPTGAGTHSAECHPEKGGEGA